MLWPDFAERDLFDAIASYQRRERRFGLVGARVPAESAKADLGNSPAEAAKPASRLAGRVGEARLGIPIESALAAASGSITRIAI